LESGFDVKVIPVSLYRRGYPRRLDMNHGAKNL
jgi:hypothetical protein